MSEQSTLTKVKLFDAYNVSMNIKEHCLIQNKAILGLWYNDMLLREKTKKRKEKKYMSASVQ